VPWQGLPRAALGAALLRQVQARRLTMLARVGSPQFLVYRKLSISSRQELPVDLQLSVAEMA